MSFVIVPIVFAVTFVLAYYLLNKIADGIRTARWEPQVGDRVKLLHKHLGLMCGTVKALGVDSSICLDLTDKHGRSCQMRVTEPYRNLVFIGRAAGGTEA